MREFIMRDKKLILGNKTYIMGIVNITPDSFSDGNQFFSVESALTQCEKLIADGADIIDIGACSTRPDSTPVSEEEEWERLKGILSELRKMTDVLISVDTFREGIAEKCLEMGADIINDVSGVYSSSMAQLIKKYNAGWVLMHGGVKTGKTESIVDFENGVTQSVQDFFDNVLLNAEKDGIAEENICLDVGFGFSKTNEQNIELFRNLDTLDTGLCALLSGLSRKRFIGALSEDSDVSDRLGGTLAANVLSVEKGVDIVRVHEVALHRKALTLADKL
ncbi:MAG: dihydropteroate synthase, partial [Clostridia bacterium]|nr:dihydropteroate synthase [Clostridia bacterium]